METPPVLTERMRGGFVECRHRGHWAVVNAAGELVDGGGDASLVVLPRSSAKPLQALPLVESGAAKAVGLEARHLALACASHNGAPIHSDTVTDWLKSIERREGDLRCGPQPPHTSDDRQTLRDQDRRANQTHNNCSGKHTGFVTLSRHLGAGPEYVDPTHPVQLAVREAVEDMCDEETAGFATDGCSAPNFATSIRGMAKAMAKIANAQEDASGVRDRAAYTLREAMIAHPEMVAGEGRACTRLMRAAGGRAMLKGGAEGYYVAAIPGAGLGIAMKMEDGSGPASEVAITAILVRLGVLDANDPEVSDLLRPKVTNWRKIETGTLRPAF